MNWIILALEKPSKLLGQVFWSRLGRIPGVQNTWQRRRESSPTPASLIFLYSLPFVSAWKCTRTFVIPARLMLGTNRMRLWEPRFIAWFEQNSTGYAMCSCTKCRLWTLLKNTLMFQLRGPICTGFWYRTGPVRWAMQPPRLPQELASSVVTDIYPLSVCLLCCEVTVDWWHLSPLAVPFWGILIPWLTPM